MAELFRGARSLRLEAEENSAASRWKYTAVVMLLARCVDTFCSQMERTCAMINGANKDAPERLILIAEKLGVRLNFKDITLIRKLTTANFDFGRRKRRQSYRSEVLFTSDQPIDPSGLADLAPLWDDAGILARDTLFEVESAVSRLLEQIWAALNEDSSDLLAPSLISYSRQDLAI